MPSACSLRLGAFAFLLACPLWAAEVVRSLPDARVVEVVEMDLGSLIVLDRGARDGWRGGVRAQGTAAQPPLLLVAVRSQHGAAILLDSDSNQPYRAGDLVRIATHPVEASR